MSTLEKEATEMFWIPPGIAKKPEPLFSVRLFLTKHPEPSEVQMLLMTNDLVAEQEVLYFTLT